ncbi:Bax inhibitor 1 family protein [Acidithiobacillus ferrooxidans]|uniref:hypothetical protein n=1 Tax=Acidithiobacillus ferrooxidans TaxID=920 RepID=UPI000AF7493D|nr:hypothetical protein [Acidithiobacillus ferrooxidans]MCR1342795.1 hypothetical protein [Acidithiobacillus ferrooxidans]BDB14073.1 hypothetical protein ANFP_13930 [Acidithiobacillus ferrooxidans]
MNKNQNQNLYQFPDSMNPVGTCGDTSIGKTYALLAATLVVFAIAFVYGMHSIFAYQHPFILRIGSFALIFGVEYACKRSSPFAVPLVFLLAGDMGMLMGAATSQIWLAAFPQGW